MIDIAAFFQYLTLCLAHSCDCCFDGWWLFGQGARSRCRLGFSTLSTLLPLSLLLVDSLVSLSAHLLALSYLAIVDCPWKFSSPWRATRSSYWLLDAYWACECEVTACSVEARSFYSASGANYVDEELKQFCVVVGQQTFSKTFARKSAWLRVEEFASGKRSERLLGVIAWCG